MTQPPFTLLQLSDAHFLADPEGHYRDQNPDACLARLKPALEALKPDGLLLTGDMAEDGSRAAYERVVMHLEGLAPRVGWIPGNHDDMNEMRSVFEAAGYDSGPLLQWGGWRLALLNSVMENDPAGELDQHQLSLLDQLGQDPQPTLVFVHHQPILVDSPWIDRFALRSPEKLIERLDPEWARAVAFGHVHQIFSAIHEGVQYLSAPATSVNSQAQMERFTIDPTGPKARWFRLMPEGRWATGVISAG